MWKNQQKQQQLKENEHDRLIGGCSFFEQGNDASFSEDDDWGEFVELNPEHEDIAVKFKTQEALKPHNTIGLANALKSSGL